MISFNPNLAVGKAGSSQNEVYSTHIELVFRNMRRVPHDVKPCAGKV